MIYEVSGADNTYNVSVRRDSQGVLWVAVGDEEPVRFDSLRPEKGEWRLPGESRPVGVAVAGETVDVTLGGDPFRFGVVDARRAALRNAGGGAAGEIRTQMPGAVVRVLVAVGDTVQEGQPVIVVEAMKMENEFKAGISGTVAGIHVAAGDAIDSGTLLVTIEEGA